MWDSLGIVLYLTERHTGVWPADPGLRAFAIFATIELHRPAQAAIRHRRLLPGQQARLAMSTLMPAPRSALSLLSCNGGWVAEDYDWRLTFIIPAIPGLFLAILAWFLVAERKRKAARSGSGPRSAAPAATSGLA